MNKEELHNYCKCASNEIIRQDEQIRKLIKENQELKKQVETYEIEGYEQNEELNKMSFDIRKYKVQQKEFMNFLTEAINKLKLEQETSNSAILKANTDLQMEVYSIVLSKYKEIIGV